MKSMSLIGSDAIRKNQANNSTSKNACAFSKTKRFPNPNPQCKIAFYSNDSKLSNRKASFGYGSKSDFTKTLTASPSATTYQHKSIFQDNKNKSIGRSFGSARQKIPDRSYLIPQLGKVPGPGQYQHNKQTISPVKYTFREKTNNFIQNKLTYKMNPGPGSYKQVQLDPKGGRYKLAKFGDTKFAKIQPHLARFQTIKETPGPSSYIGEGDGVSQKGKYVLSNHKGAGTRAFSTTVRRTFTEQVSKSVKNLPGPGNYEKPTDFGYYGDAKYYRKK